MSETPDSMTKAPETKGSVIHWASLYDPLSKVMTLGKDSDTRRVTIEAAAIRPGERVLDVGCGTGTLALLAAEAAGETGEVQGVDASPEMIGVATRKATKQGANVRFQVGLIEKLPFPDAHFDLVLSSFMLHHLPDDLKCDGFVEIARVIKPGGRLLAVDLSGQPGSLFWRLMTMTPGHKMPADYPQRLSSLIEGAGLTPEVLPSAEPQYLIVRGVKPA
jgi:demethylmenaquinone methyltransferase/2-methoxy-6-polyprenyl-1,4-benzoquinol methylase/phosphoethanolamine N-methyltransferase